LADLVEGYSRTFCGHKCHSERGFTQFSIGFDVIKWIEKLDLDEGDSHRFFGKFSKGNVTSRFIQGGLTREKVQFLQILLRVIVSVFAVKNAVENAVLSFLL
jgi:hypothetical protein